MYARTVWRRCMLMLGLEGLTTPRSPSNLMGSCHTTFHFTPSREKISVSNDLVNWPDNPFLVLNVFDPQWLLFFHSTYTLGLQSKILSEHTATFSHNKGRRFGETRLVTFSKFCTWEFEINYIWERQKNYSWTSPYELFYNDDTSLWCTVLFAGK